MVKGARTPPRICPESPTTQYWTLLVPETIDSGLHTAANRSDAETLGVRGLRPRSVRFGKVWVWVAGSAVWQGCTWLAAGSFDRLCSGGIAEL